LHHPATVDFTVFRPAEFSGNLFVNIPAMTSCITELTRREQIKETPSIVLFRTAPSLLGGADQRAHALSNLSLRNGWKKIDRTRFHCLRAHWDVAVASDKDKLFWRRP
jgi:hypothetical protein